MRVELEGGRGGECDRRPRRMFMSAPATCSRTSPKRSSSRSRGGASRACSWSNWPTASTSARRLRRANAVCSITPAIKVGRSQLGDDFRYRSASATTGATRAGCRTRRRSDARRARAAQPSVSCRFGAAAERHDRRCEQGNSIRGWPGVAVRVASSLEPPAAIDADPRARNGVVHPDLRAGPREGDRRRPRHKPSCATRRAPQRPRSA